MHEPAISHADDHIFGVLLIERSRAFRDFRTILKHLSLAFGDLSIVVVDACR
jgi:hypothetical protein